MSQNTESIKQLESIERAPGVSPRGKLHTNRRGTEALYSLHQYQ